jgi:AraC-like DNA-binding protein
VRASPYRGSKADRAGGRAAAYSTTAGLLGAHIGRQLNFDGANLTNPDGHALQMQELQVRSHPWGVGLSEAESRRLTARRLDGRAGITGVVSRFLGDLARHGDQLSGAQSERVLADVTDLVVTLLGDWADDSEGVRSSLQRSLLVRVKDYIDRRLPDPTLGPAEIAAAVNISPRYLHKLFTGEHRSVGQYIRGLRLERCRRDLLDPRLADQSIAAIAFGWGFGDLSGFNRAFRAAFGATPREVRARPSAGPLR